MFFVITILGFQVDFSDFITSYEVKAFGFRSDVIQVYSNSWGPNDDGFVVQGPGLFSYDALYDGITNVSLYYIVLRINCVLVCNDCLY